LRQSYFLTPIVWFLKLLKRIRNGVYTTLLFSRKQKILDIQIIRQTFHVRHFLSYNVGVDIGGLADFGLEILDIGVYFHSFQPGSSKDT